MYILTHTKEEHTHTHTLKHKTSFLLENVNELYGKNLEVTEMITKKRFVVQIHFCFGLGIGTWN